MKALIEYYYTHGIYTIAQLQTFVHAGYITEEELQEITNAES